MNELDKKVYLNRYYNRLNEFAYNPKTLGWSDDKNKQLLRFQIAIDSEQFCKTPIQSVLDIGCGFGDMGGILLKERYPHIKYTGIDINEQLVEEGNRQFPFLDLRVGNVLKMDLEKYDLVCASGLFNYALKYEDQIAYMDTMLNKFYSLCNKAVAVDFLSTYVDFMHPDSYHTKIEDVFHIAKKLSKRVVIRNDYLDFEYCTYIFKETK